MNTPDTPTLVCRIIGRSGVLLSPSLPGAALELPDFASATQDLQKVDRKKRNKKLACACALSL